MNKILAFPSLIMDRNLKQAVADRGWELRYVSQELERAPDVLKLYYLQPLSNPTLLSFTSLSPSAFIDLKDQINSDSRLQPETICSALIHFSTQLEDDYQHNDYLRLLMVSSCLYCLSTGYFSNMKPSTLFGQCHVILHHYIDHRNQRSHFRPFSIIDDAPILSPEELQEHSHLIMAMDRQYHPEWFTTAEIIPFPGAFSV
ncbi:hypothetical protein OLMES_3744 [Oleiphilus messinensis]|uniref:DUF4116 domain-containing protein n=1 Tax=Oleiphilus messinensis TaxID=141451 RepID=A0A1Y0IE55_9GAMM|nr:hypothetical protein [Oleiphilus messinensis]ARU57765.1 hypothetical protein OLMES_3744 [Oleiphilus messinensis]